MKLRLFALSALLLVANWASAQETPQEKFKKLYWLSGEWTRTNAKAGQSGYETWAKTSAQKLSGKGVTVEGKKTVFVEQLEMIIKGADIFYVVRVTGESKPVYFKLTALTDDSFTCENPQHDFPKKISYKRNGKNLKAVISGGGQSVDYIFVKK
jgi:hypothetical protein